MHITAQQEVTMAASVLLLLAMLVARDAWSCPTTDIINNHRAPRMCAEPTKAFLAKVNGVEFNGCLLMSDDAATSATMSCKESETSIRLSWAGKALSGCSDELQDIELLNGTTGPVKCGPNPPSQSFHAVLRDNTYVGCLEYSTGENQADIDCGPQALPLSISWKGHFIDACLELPRYYVCVIYFTTISPWTLISL